MSAPSQTDGRAPAAKLCKLTDNLDPNEPLKNYIKDSDTLYSVEFERKVPGHGTLRFKLSQRFIMREGVFCLRVVVECLDQDWRQIDDRRLRVFVRIRGQEKSFTANTNVDKRNGQMLCGDVRLNGVDSLPRVCCSIEKCDNNFSWNRFREIDVEPAKFGGPECRFVLQSVDGVKYYVHYGILADCSPMLQRCMEANLDGIADGVPFKLQCSAQVLSALLELIYLNDTPCINDYICGMVEQANFLGMVGVVGRLVEHMREQLSDVSFERLIEWLHCASQHDLDNNNLEVDIWKRLGVLAGDDQEKKEVLKDQMKEYIKKNPEKVAEMAVESLFNK